MKNIRHGDIILSPSNENNGEIIKHNGSFVLAEGETTGHKHVISVPRLEDMDIKKLTDGRIQLTLKTDGYVVHEEHKKLVVKKGTYVVEREQEYSYFELHARQVID